MSVDCAIKLPPSHGSPGLAPASLSVQSQHVIPVLRLEGLGRMTVVGTFSKVDFPKGVRVGVAVV